jgi:hypothetical protein
MEAIREFAGKPLLWVQPKAMKQQFELCCGNEVLAVMRWQSSWRSSATAETAEGSWSFKRQGFRRQVQIESNWGDSMPPTLQRRWTGSATLIFPDGRLSYLWKRNGFWGIKRVWTTMDGVPLLSFKTRPGFLKTSGEVEIDPLAADLPELALLVSLGWYLLIMETRDAAVAARAAAGGS